MTNWFIKIFCIVLAVHTCSATSSANGLIGSMYEKTFSLTGKPSKALLPEYEQQVRTVADELGMFVGDVKHSHESLVVYGPCGMGNTLYFSNDLFVQWKNDPVALKFIIAHELGHIEGNDTLKRLVCLSSISFVSSYLLYQLSHSTGIADTVDAYCAQKLPSWISAKARSWYGRIWLCNLGFTIGALATLKLARSQEFAADARALEKLAPMYGREAVTNGAARVLSKDFGFEPVMRGLLSTHPHSGDRLRALCLPQSASKEAGAQILQLLRDRVHIRYELCVTEYEKERPLVAARLNANWLELSQKARICSVHQDVAQQCIAMINEQKASYGDLVVTKFNDFISRAENNDYCAHHPLLAHAEQNAETSRLIKEAMLQECEMLILALQEKL